MTQRTLLFVLAACGLLFAQGYDLTVVTKSSKTLQAIHFGYKPELPLAVPMTGTVLLPKAEGRAQVRGRSGATEVDLRVSGLESPGRFGAAYLTYVLWAITPQGRPVALAELIANHANKVRVKVSTPLQSFAMIVTAEPHFAVTRPGPVVVLENSAASGAQSEEVRASADFLPRQQFTFDASSKAEGAEGPMVSMAEYEKLLALYQAQNALQLAQSEGADQHAAEAFRKAQSLYQEALSLKAQKGAEKRAAMIARQATQAAEDARTIAARRAKADAGSNE